MEKCVDWLYKQRDKVEGGPYGWTRETIEQSLKYQRDLRQEIDDYLSTISKLPDSERDHCEEIYNNLNQFSKNKIHCLENVWNIVTMQGLCVEFSRKFDSRAVHLVQERGFNPPVEEGNNPGFISASSQDCIFATRDSWNWLLRLVGCIDIHMKNASEYQQFFHEVDESGMWMREDLHKLVTAFTLGSVTGEYQEAENLRQKLQDIVTAFRQWEAKTDFLWSRALKLAPVHLRTETLENPVPARVIADYKGPDYSVRTDEDILLLNNDDAQLWRVRNARGEEGDVPAACVLIPGPDRDAIEAAARLRMQLLAAWTYTIKTVGKRLLVFLLTVFKAHYDDEQIGTMRSISMMDRQDLMRTLDNIENSLLTHWKDHEGFQMLQERLLMLRMILDKIPGDGGNVEEHEHRALVVQISALEKLLRQYEDLWRKWETFKTALETSRAPELMLVVDKWDQLKFIAREEFSKLWQNQLPFDDHERNLADIQHLSLEGASISDVSYDSEFAHHATNGFGENVFSPEVNTVEGSYSRATVNSMSAAYGMAGGGGDDECLDGGMLHEGVSEYVTGFEDATVVHGSEETSSFGYASETKTARTEQLLSAQVEESRRFVIKSVVEPTTGADISLNDSIRLGIIKPDEGVYVNTKTNEQIPISEAMSEGLIKVAFSTMRRGKEKLSTIGLITVKTVRVPVRPYTIKTVLDTLRNETISKEDAVKRRILAIDLGVVKCTKTGKEFHIPEAAEKGIIDIEYTGPQPEPEVIQNCYAVRAAVDLRAKKIISFHDAVVRGVIEKESGEFKDTSTGKTMHIADAIMKGYLKARKIDNPNTMDINADNTMFLDITQKIRQKILEPIKQVRRQSSEINHD